MENGGKERRREREIYGHHIFRLQSNLSTTATHWTTKKWPLYRGGQSVEGFQSKLVSELAWPDFVWPLLTGSCCSEVAVNTGLTSHLKKIVWQNLA
jgi:hypothetical protein